MANNELLNKIEALNSWEDLMEEAKAEAEAIKDEIKRELEMRDTEELVCGPYIVRYANILTQRFDSTAFKREHSELYKAFIKQSASRRFTITA